MIIVNPATGKVIKEVEEDSTSLVVQAYQDLKRGQVEWGQIHISERLDCLSRFKNLLIENIDRLALLLTREVGKPLPQSIGEINGAIDRIDYFLTHSENVLKERIVNSQEGLIEKVSFEPLGVVANISAWNYPYLIGVNVFIPALISGNSVLYKPSECSVLTGLAIEELLVKAGIPRTSFRCIKGASTIGKELLKLPINGCFFTGSTHTGQYIYEQMAKKMVPCQMELGGKDPMYVSSHNTDITYLAKAAVEGSFYNNGQSCCAVERIYVHQSIATVFIEAFVKELSTLIQGNPETEGVFFGPVTRKEQLQVLEDQISDAVGKGAKILFGGQEVTGSGYYFQPTVLLNVSHKMKIMKEESFGPIIGIQEVKDTQEALSLMNDTIYGLTASIYTESFLEFESMASSLNSGTVYHNCCDRVSASLPWSGRKKSGIGCTLSEEGIKAFVQPKSWQIKS
jgi:acyl-CoA reductase-like NAD-dependent aldehyde dehydrogenase